MTTFRRSLLPVLLLVAWCAPAVAGVAVSYRDLIDETQLVRTGETLGSALRQRPLPRGTVQPFLDPHTTLLAQAVDMLEGAPAQPYRDIAELFPEGNAQPAWAALCRDGKLVIESDGAGKVRLFLPGNAPRTAYREQYGIVRHALASLAAGRAATAGDSTLSVRVYAYRHDYARSEFDLVERPYTFRAAMFPAPANTTPPDLAALDAFFRSGAVLTGATAGRDGLTLLGEAGTRMTLQEQPVTLADLAVAWRAAAHAGDNAAFISLDPHRDPTRATVSFGGRLEDTRLGSTVLEADKRFKMIGTGLDASTFTDERAALRAAHPGFLTSAERDLLVQAVTEGNWIGTRFWFYPESVELATDADWRTMRITSARFTADAERQRGDFTDAAAFARERTKLSPGIRGCIDDLNRHYDRYAAACSDLRELRSAARLLGLCSWLTRRPGRELDLDALLAVELPAHRTPRDKPQLLAANWLAVPRHAAPDSAYAATHLVADYLTPLLDDPARTFWPERGDEPARQHIATTQALQEFVMLAARQRAREMTLRSARAGGETQPAGGFYSAHIISIGGGINLGADEFRIRVQPRSGARPTPARQPAATAPPRVVTPLPAPPLVVRSMPAQVRTDTAARVTARASWSERTVTAAGVQERRYDAATNTLTVTTDTGAARLVGRRTGNRIVFARPR